MTTEEIDKAARLCAMGYTHYEGKTNSEIDFEQGNLSDTFKEGVKFADKHWQEKTRWIPITERLPLKQSRTRQILGKNKHTVSVVFISCADEGYLNSLESLKREFTHWKEIE